MRADLHLHSYYSDGSESPTAVVERAKAAGLDLIALTDHDSLGGYDEAERAARAAQAAGIELIPAAEFTATHRGQEIHLLGYFPAWPGREVEAHLEGMQSFRRRRMKEAVTRLQKRGVDVRFEDLPCAPVCQSLTAAHLAILLAQKGFAPSARAAWRKLLNRNILPPFEATATDVIQVIHAGGGLAVWAHPWRKRFKSALEALCADGLDGLEAANFRRGLAGMKDLQVQARKLGLLATGGSDWHGGPESSDLGEFAADEEFLGDFLVRMGRAPEAVDTRPRRLL
jgi:hypothetical protein